MLHSVLVFPEKVLLVVFIRVCPPTYTWFRLDILKRDELKKIMHAERSGTKQRQIQDETSELQDILKTNLSHTPDYHETKP